MVTAQRRVAVVIIKASYVELCVCVTGVSSGDNSRGKFI